MVVAEEFLLEALQLGRLYGQFKAGGGHVVGCGRVRVWCEDWCVWQTGWVRRQDISSVESG